MDKNFMTIIICMLLLAAFLLGITVGEKITRRSCANVSRVVPEISIAGMGTDTPVRPEHDIMITYEGL